MGASVGLIGYELALLNAAIQDAFEGKGESIVEQNVSAARAGYDYVMRAYPEPYKGGIVPTADPRRMTLTGNDAICMLSLIHISEPTRQAEISYAVFCLKKK